MYAIWVCVSKILQHQKPIKTQFPKSGVLVCFGVKYTSSPLEVKSSTLQSYTTTLKLGGANLDDFGSFSLLKARHLTIPFEEESLQLDALPFPERKKAVSERVFVAASNSERMGINGINWFLWFILRFLFGIHEHFQVGGKG